MFLLVGEQIAPVVHGLKAYPVSVILTAAAISLGVVLLLRPLWLALNGIFALGPCAGARARPPHAAASICPVVR